MPKKSSVVCPNPKCGKKFEEPILLNVLFVDPPTKYEACPYCFTNLEEFAPIKEEPTKLPKETESKATAEQIKESSASVFGRVRSMIPNIGKKEEIEEIQNKPVVSKKEEPAPKIKNAVRKEEEKKPASPKKEDSQSGCPESFGYLANRPKDEPIPQSCLMCPRMVDCMLSPRVN